jgi:predicted MFS family arabinose efflux permease
MWPAFQTMFINLAPHTQRGTANSSILISWDICVGLGILVGGVFVEHFGYHSAFWAAWILNAVGVIFYFAYVRNNYLKNRLR